MSSDTGLKAAGRADDCETEGRFGLKDVAGADFGIDFSMSKVGHIGGATFALK